MKGARAVLQLPQVQDELMDLFDPSSRQPSRRLKISPFELDSSRTFTFARQSIFSQDGGIIAILRPDVY